MGTLLLIGNPTAQSGRNAARIVEARHLLDARGLAHRFLATAPGGATVALVREALSDEDIDTVVAMGGDGTFAEVARGLLGSGRAPAVRMGHLPTGTANDQGRSFGLDSDESHLPHNVDVIAAGAEVRLDAGHIQALDASGEVLHEELFFDSAGWGISPRVLAVRNEDRQFIAGIPLLRDIYRDQLVYAGALFRTFLSSYVEDGKFNATVVADGRTHHFEGLTDLVVKATRIYGGLWVLDPLARHDDGRFEVVPFLGKRDWVSKAIVHLDGSGALRETLAMVGVTESESISASSIDIDFVEQPGMPLSAQLDGEEWIGTTRARIKVLPRALRLLVPASETREQWPTP